MRFGLYAAVVMSLTLGACSTYVEEVASKNFMPVLPEEPLAEPTIDGAIYNRQSQGLFATERKASKVGDIVTISLDESFNASKSQSAATGKTDSYAIDLPNGLMNDILGRSVKSEDYALGTTQSFNGTGTASQSNAINGLVSAAVVRLFSNGNLEVMGQKKLTLNNGDEYVRVSGIVRPQDIGVGNIVNSNRLANAQITYIGAGEVADTAKRGWLSKLITTISPI